VDADPALEPDESIICHDGWQDERDQGKCEERNGFHGAASWWW